MHSLDMRTVMFSYALIQAMCVAVAWALWRANRYRYPGVTFWLAHYALQFLSITLLLLRGYIPDLISIVAANTASIAGIILLRAGLGRFLGKKAASARDWALLPLFAAVYYYFTFFQPDINARNITLNTAVLLLSLECIWTLLKDTPPALFQAAKPPAAAFLALASLSLARILYTLRSPQSENMFQVSSVHALLVMFYMAFTAALILSLFLMIYRRLLEDTKNDLSGRIQAEENLSASEERFQKIFQAAPMLMSLSEVATGRYIEVNEKFCEVTGFTREELIGKTSTEIGWINKEVRDRLIKTSNGLSARIPEIVLRAKGGRLVTCSYACELVRVGFRFMMLAIAEDITERRLAEEALKVGEARFKLVVESAPEAIFVQSAGKFTYLNPACCALFGAPGQQDLLGKDFMERMAPEFRDDIRKRIQQQIVSAVPSPLMEQKFLRLDGSRIAVETTAVPVKFGGLDSHLVFVRDITERKRAEAELLRAQKMESVGVLAGGIAHDFNNLLTGITGNLSLIRNVTGPDGEIPELVKEAEGACLTAKGLARQLLTFSSGGEPVKQLLDLGQLVTDSVAFALRGSSIGKTVKIEGGPLAASADKDQLFQVIQNLVINAAQAMPGGGTLSVNLAPVDLKAGEIAALPAGSYARLEVRDTGSGITAERLPRLFEPYFSTKGQGRGLGLAVCRSIIIKHGGQIEVFSEPGLGSVFTIHLPLEKKAVEPEPGAPAKAPAKGVGSILIMDDEAIVYKALKRMLNALGYEAEVAVNGEQALAAWENAMKSGNLFRAVIMDLTIAGGMGGVETIKKLLELDPSAKAVVSSGYSEDPAIARHREHGFSGVLVKPYRYEDVGAVLAELLQPEK